MQYVKYDPTDVFYKSVVGAVAENCRFGIRLQINRCMNPSSVTLVVYSDDGASNNEYVMYREQGGDEFDNYLADLQLKKGLYWYYFKMEGVPYEKFVGISANKQAALFFDNVQPYQLSVYKKQYKTPSWLNKGVMYQIMVDRFYHSGNTVVTEDKILRPWGEQPYFREEDGVVRNRDFFGGNLAGVTEKLPYLASLNVTTLYLNPIFKAYSNHKYDTEDYEQIDPMFGSDEDFENLCAKAREYGISVILDGVFNHTGSSSKYFNRGKKYGEGGAYNDEKSPYRSWFNFYPDNSYECWWNFQTLPRINAESRSAQKYFCDKTNGVVPRWLKAGAYGWRLDVVDEIADSMLDKIVSSAKSAKPDCAVIGEVWEDASNKTDYGVRRHYLDGSQLDSVMNYPLMNGIIDFVRDGNEASLSYVVFDILNNYPLHVRNNLMNILGTHDTARILTTLAGDRVENSSKEILSKTKLTDEQYERGVQLLKMAAVLQYTVFGFPCVFYGDEAALEGYRDPFCRACYPWGRENKTVLDFYRRLGELRKNPVFAEGSFVQLVAEHGVYAFERVCQSSQTEVVVAANRGGSEYDLDLNAAYEDMLTGRRYQNVCKLQRNGFVVLKKV
ncbi:MAG: glycoside hydrolase family 13 protein [Corallococcus sp.]|nr:glycoside hydrolase family 13 protein [Corallococcus sp.]MCM1359772.1 glycoside hydrolase family 13 protein [Corallococcus sp.]MCM1395702.1 glycoside hydrolase family 13 protein [Corallococcus sp.]